MNYAEITDFEINLAVAHATLGSGNYDYDSEKKEVYFAGIDGGEFLPNAYFDPCNSWANAGPIIEDNRITIDAAPDVWFARDENHCYTHENPKRAAMIVFLMMQEGKNG